MRKSISLKELEELGACDEGMCWFQLAFGSRASLKDLITALRRKYREDWEAWLLSRNYNLTKAALLYGANPHAGRDYALEIAAEGSDSKLVKFLCEQGFDADAGESALDSAVTYKRVENIRILMNHGAKVIEDILLAAVHAENKEILQIFLDHKVDFSPVREYFAEQAHRLPYDWAVWLMAHTPLTKEDLSEALKNTVNCGRFDLAALLHAGGARIL
jgi:hypothetical protein